MASASLSLNSVHTHSTRLRAHYTPHSESTLSTRVTLGGSAPMRILEVGATTPPHSDLTTSTTRRPGWLSGRKARQDRRPRPALTAGGSVDLHGGLRGSSKRSGARRRRSTSATVDAQVRPLSVIPRSISPARRRCPADGRARTPPSNPGGISVSSGREHRASAASSAAGARLEQIGVPPASGFEPRPPPVARERGCYPPLRQDAKSEKRGLLAVDVSASRVRLQHRPGFAEKWEVVHGA